ncbi:hypothetical protein I6A60_12685 [Frankia sp. AgB1.9]|uniref:hypothetical protein n=1 Tax=unclassified Frankia TaxID=2632575 RepID=UPI001931CF18|nr:MULTISPECIES: hypothetical protein [unclassified Frankia]MBL7492573.1 hypothetical protein [Frankia sp. AgW1.1]MBL7548726.1 hypothetical protein [Frankia sp. AgB1.9]MBL7619324.1 hypothetical protein [Frankia sp. AgB1.8]
MILEVDAGQTIRVPRTAAVVQHLTQHGIEDGLARLGLRLEVRTAVGAVAEGREWIPALQRFRGAVIWENGLRPAFRRSEGLLLDPDPHDELGYHLVLRTLEDDAIAACLRGAPVRLLPDSRVLDWDPALAERLLAERGYAPADVLEPGRLVVAPAWRRTGVATAMCLAAFGLGRVTGHRLLWSTVGTGRSQDRMVADVGWQIRDEFGRRPAPELLDTLCVATAETMSVRADLEPVVVAFSVLIGDLLHRAGNSANAATEGPRDLVTGVRSGGRP